MLIFIAFISKSQQFIPFKAQDVDKTLGLAETKKNLLECQVLGIGGVSDLNDAKKLGGNLSLGAYVLLRTQSNDDRFRRHAIYVFYNSRAGSTEDTVVVAKTYLFPDIGKRDFTLGYEWLLGHENSIFTLIPFSEISFTRNILNRNEQDPEKFHAYNFTFGMKLKLETDFTVGSEMKRFGISLNPYVQSISIDPKDFKTRNEMLNEKDLPPTFHTIGVYSALQIAELGIFANYKRIMNKTEAFTDKNLKDGILVIGLLVGTDIFKFSKKRE